MHITLSKNLSPQERKAICLEHQQKLNNEAVQAINENKIFKIYGSCEVLRKELIERGWIEKITYSKERKNHYRNLNNLNEARTHVLSKLVKEAEPNFVYNAIENWNYKKYHQNPRITYNRFYMKAPWTQKKSLCAFKNICFEDESQVNIPYTYMSCDQNEKEEFVSNYKLTACTSILKLLLSRFEKHVPIFTESGNVSIQVLVFAINRCKEYLYKRQHKDVDYIKFSTVTNKEWRLFFKNYYILISSEDNTFQLECKEKLPLYLDLSRVLIHEIQRYRPQLSCEGYRNIWIIKPISYSSGFQLKIASKLDDLCKLIKKPNYIFQKYIEEPLLIYQTKFIIRQFFLITCTSPLEVWMYEDSYLMFSSQLYTLQSFHESIHFSNYQVQKYCKNSPDLHPDIPESKMWSSDTFKEYLQTNFKEDAWDTIIYPGMRNSIIGVLLSFQDSLPYAKNRFELYGCDFVLDRDYKPWLIEMNSCPDLDSTTSVTAKICPAVISDMVKVVIDRAKNYDAETGKFECIYGKEYVTYPKKSACFTAQGSRILGIKKHKKNIKETKSETYKENQPSIKTLINVLKIKHSTIPLKNKNSFQSKKSSVPSIGVASRIFDAVFAKQHEKKPRTKTKDTKLKNQAEIPKDTCTQEILKKASAKLSKIQTTSNSKQALRLGFAGKLPGIQNKTKNKSKNMDLKISCTVSEVSKAGINKILYINNSKKVLSDTIEAKKPLSRNKNEAIESTVPLQTHDNNKIPCVNLPVKDEQQQFTNGDSNKSNAAKQTRTSFFHYSSADSGCITPIEIAYVQSVQLSKKENPSQLLNEINPISNVAKHAETPLSYTHNAAIECVVPVQVPYGAAYMDGQILHTKKINPVPNSANRPGRLLPPTNFFEYNEHIMPVQNSYVLNGQSYDMDCQKLCNYETSEYNSVRTLFPQTHNITSEHIEQLQNSSIFPYAQLSAATGRRVTHINTNGQVSNVSNQTRLLVCGNNNTSTVKDCQISCKIKARQMSDCAVQVKVKLPRTNNTLKDCIVPVQFTNSRFYAQSDKDRNETSKTSNVTIYARRALPRTKTMVPMEIHNTSLYQHTSTIDDYILCSNKTSEISNVDIQTKSMLPRSINVSTECLGPVQVPCNISHKQTSVMNGKITSTNQTSKQVNDHIQSKLATSIASIKKLPSKCKAKTKFSCTTSKAQSSVVFGGTVYTSRGSSIRRPVTLLSNE